MHCCHFIQKIEIRRNRMQHAQQQSGMPKARSQNAFFLLL
jgi:hypothetical protein